MLLKLFVLFTVVPLLELALLIWLSSVISIWPTVAIVIVTALVGALLGKFQGLRALRRVQDDVSQGRLPGDSLLDGLAILIASILLVTPGIISDGLAIVLLIPPLRAPLRKYFRRRFEASLHQGSVSFLSPGSQGPSPFGPFGFPFGHPGGGEEIIDVTPRDDDEPSTESTSKASLRDLSDR